MDESKQQSLAFGDSVMPSLIRDTSVGTTTSSEGKSFRAMPADVPAQMFEDAGMPLNFSGVVKVLSTIAPQDFDTPWQTQGVQKVSGSGVAIRTGADNELKILTSAHVVADQTFLQVQRAGMETPDKYVATVEAVCNDGDLALLDVEDEDFWKGIKPAQLGRMPEMRSIVLVAGFPIGGGELSITEGVVCRTEGQTYHHSRRKLLAITVDAAINEGNSGGPVFNVQGELVGIAFQGMHWASNIGHIIPPTVINHFLSGVVNAGPSGYQGFPGSGLETQELDNPYLRAHHQVDTDVRGVRVTKVFFGQTCEGVLKPGDIITHVSDQPVANNGTVAYGKYGRVEIDIVFSMMQVGSPVELRIVRDGTPTAVTATTKPLQQLVPLQFHNKHPPYFIYCGLVFQPLSLDYINKAKGGMNPVYVALYYNGLQRKDWKEAIVLSQVLSDQVNVGYEGLVCEKILKVNGENVVDLVDLISKIESASESTVLLECCCDQVIILPSPNNPDAKVANERICQNYCLSRDRYVEI